MVTGALYRSRPMCQGQTNNGFTLLEMLFVMTLFAIVVSAGIPMLSDMVGRHVAGTELRKFGRSVSFARAESIIRRADVVICPRQENSLDCYSGSINSDQDESKAWRAGWLVFVDRTDSPSSIDESGGDILLKLFDGVADTVDLSLSGNTGGGSLGYIRFRPKEGSYPIALSALFCVQNNSHVVYGGKALVSRGRMRFESDEQTRAECSV